MANTCVHHVDTPLHQQDWERHATGSAGSVQLTSSSSDSDNTAAAGTTTGTATTATTTATTASAAWTPLCTARRLRALRRLLLTSTKRAFWNSILAATATPTPLPHDEYEDPREVRLVRLNRVRAAKSRLAVLRSAGERLKHSVFGQLHREAKVWPSSAFRR
jgi:hypothetical protein